MPPILVAGMQQANARAVGDVAESMLTEAQYQAQNGTQWILADGRNVAGSNYHTITGNTTVPDLRGVGRRGKNNGRSDGSQDPDGERALGSFQDHAFNSHAHGGATGTHNHGGATGPHTHNYAQIRGGLNNGGGVAFQANDSNLPANTLTTNATASIPNGTASISNDGGNETRMRNVAVNVFIKINY